MINTAQHYMKLIWIPIGVNIAFIALIPILEYLLLALERS